MIMMTSLLTKTVTEYGNDDDDTLCHDFCDHQVMGMMMMIWCDDNTDDCSDYNDNDDDVDLFYPDVANFCVGRLGDRLVR